MANPEFDIQEHFFSQKESLLFFETLSREIRWEQKSISIFGKLRPEPRLTAWYGDAHAVYAYSGVSMKPHAWIPTLLEIKSRVEKNCESYFNSVLLNFYRNHHDSMGLHSDDEKELGEEPVIASVSFGESRRFIFKHRIQRKQPLLTHWLNSGSLLVMHGQTQKLWKHGVPKETRPCGPRINLTFRKIH